MKHGWYALALTLCLCGCNSDSEDSVVLQAGFAVKDKFGQSTDTFTAGEPVTLEITITNTARHPVVYQTTGPGHDIVVSRDAVRIWSKYAGITWAAVISDHTIGARESVVLSAIWNGVDDDGLAVPPGVYTATPELVFQVNDRLVPVPPDRTVTLQ